METPDTRWEDYQVAAEQHKVAMMYRRREAYGEQSADWPRAAVIECQRGNGRLIINQLLLREARGPFKSRARRIMSRMLDDAGVARDERVSPLAPRERRVVDSDGFITDWLILGPFSDEAGNPLDTPFVDESAIEPVEGAQLAGRTWQRVQSGFPQVELREAWDEVPPRHRAAYAAIYVYAAQDRSVLLDAPDMIELRCGADGGTKVLLNGQPVGRFDFVRELVTDSDRVPGLPLRKGWNTLVIKLHNPSGQWRFCGRLLTSAGESARDLEFQLIRPS